MSYHYACWVISYDFCHLQPLFFQIYFFFKNIFQAHYQGVKRFCSHTGSTLCRAWSGSKPFMKIISTDDKIRRLRQRVDAWVISAHISWAVPVKLFLSDYTITAIKSRQMLKGYIVYSFDENSLSVCLKYESTPEAYLQWCTTRIQLTFLKRYSNVIVHL